MPEYLAPGVYVEEVSFRSKSIEGVSTTTTGFIGPTRYGPVDLKPDITTTLGEFERVYGDRQQLAFSGGKPMHNFMWHAVRAFFEEGGKRLYVARTYRPAKGHTLADSCARAVLPAGAANPKDQLSVRARFPGAPGKIRVRLSLGVGHNVLGGQKMPDGTVRRTFAGLRPFDVVWVADVSSPIGSPSGSGRFYVATLADDKWTFENPAVGSLSPDQLTPDANPLNGDQVRVVTLTVTVPPSDENGLPLVWAGLSLDPRHQESGQPNSFKDYFSADPSNMTLARSLPVVITIGENLATGLAVLQVLDARKGLESALHSSNPEPSVWQDVVLDGGDDDGERPTFDEYEGKAEPNENKKTGLSSFEDLEDISIVAAPGSTFGYENGYRDDGGTIVNLLISHAERMRYRIAVLDSGDGQSISAVRAMRARLDSKYAALYYPWVRVLDPVTRTEIHLPPSGFVAGIYARNDVSRAVHNAPANAVVNLAIGFEVLLNKAQQDVLNPEGINCFRFFEGRGFRLWGARTISSDPEWKYVNLRRYFAYLERSIDQGTQWVVFEPNGEALWANVRRTIEDFLLNEWMSGALLGDKPEKSYFVKCDRSTMTQNDLDNGRLVCLIGVAPLRPAEFVIFRIGQWTADRKV